ncbi:MAG TPA: translocation/assembly module TamB domain-containing protein [Puia sp.]|nr:translocation/assembly module TamB domain-containing protein [Puia sp.]
MRASSSEHPPRRSLVRRLVRIFLKTLLTIFIILLLIFFLVQTPFVQDLARAKAEKYLSRKLRTRVRVGHLDISFFKSLTLKDVYIEDLQHDTLLSAGLIDVHLKMLGLLHNNLDISEIHLSDLTANIQRPSPDTVFNYQFIVDAFAGKPAAKPDTSKGKPMVIAIHELRLDKIRLVYADSVTGNLATATIGHSVTLMDGPLDLDSGRFKVKSLRLEHTSLAFHNTPGAMATSAGIASLQTTGLTLDLNHLIIRAKTLALDSTNYALDNTKKPRLKKGMDYSHLLATNLTLHGEDLAYSPDSASGRITKGELAERSGFRLTRLQTRFFYSDRRIALDDLLLRTPGTLLQRSASLQCDSLAGMLKNPTHTRIHLDLPNSHVQLKDLLVFAPDLASQPVFRDPNTVWQLNSELDGNFDAITVRNLDFSGFRDMRLDMAGRIIHPFDSRRIRADLDIRNLSGSRAALVSLVPKNSLPSNITIPKQYDLHGRLAGSMDGVTSDLLLHTSSGSVWLKGYAQNFRSTQNARYNLDLRTRALDLGSILQDSAQWGAVTAEFRIAGTGMDVKSANSKFSGKIAAATFRHYQYHDLAIDGSIADQQATLHSTINNTAVHFELQASADLAQKFPALKVDWQVDTVDLHAMGLTKDTLQFKGRLTADFASTNPDSLQGALKLAGVNLLRGHQRLTTDSLQLTANRDGDIQDIQLHSEMADLDLRGHYLLTQLPTALQHTISRYYHLEGFKDTAFVSQDWTLRMQLRASPLALTLIPSLRGTDTVGGVLAYNSDRNDLHLGLRAPRLDLGSQFIHDITINAGTADSSLRYDISLADGHGSGLLLYKTSISGAVADDHLTTTLLLKDKQDKDRYRLAGVLDHHDGAIKFSFNPDSLLLNYDQWLVSHDNYIQYDSSGVLVHHFTISNQMDSLSLDSKGTTGAAPLDIRFGSFRLSTISRLANQDSVVADGVLNGTAEVKNVTTNPVFTSDLQIQNLSYKNDTLGDLTLKVNNEKANAFSAKIGLQGQNNDITMSGDYYTGESKMDLKLDLRRVNLSAFITATQGTVEKMRGYLMGQFTITGTLDKPNVRGNLYFDSSVITPAVSGEALDVSHDRIAFDEDGFNFSEFTLRDSAGNKLILDGNVFTKDYHKFAFDISLNAQNFRLVNAPVNSSRQFYGQLNLDAAINLEGKMDAPKIDGAIRVNKRTNFYYVLPGSDPEVGDRVGVVRFVDHRTGDTLVDKKALVLHSRQTEIKGLDVSLNLLTDTSALLNVVIDPRSGDALNIRGRSMLVFQLEKSGKMDLTGSYQVSGGYYTMSFTVIKRKFNIDPGSIITWTGDPTQATVDLNASYTAQTPSIDLVSNVISDLPQTEQYKYRQKLPFLVTLKLEGDMLKPVITFDISLPSTILTLWPDVDQRLTELRTQQSEMNEQVFALLLLGRFVGPNPMNSNDGGGSAVSSLAYSTGFQIITSQLDQAAASLIKPVDIHFDLNNQQDWSTGAEIDYTELDVTVSKQFMEDRLRLAVGSSFDIVGTGAPEQAPSNLAGTLDAAYKLTKDGRYLLRAYRLNQYEAVVFGQVIETGVGFIFNFNYDNFFKEFFHRAKGDQIEPRKTPNSRTTSNPK